jgi:hypothetical protein
LDEQIWIVSQNGVFRRTFGPKSDEVTGEWGKLHNEKVYNQYYSLNIMTVKL